MCNGRARFLTGFTASIMYNSILVNFFLKQNCVLFLIGPICVVSMAASSTNNNCGGENSPCPTVNDCVKRKFNNIKIIDDYNPPETAVTIDRDIFISGTGDSAVRKERFYISGLSLVKFRISNIRFHNFKKIPIVTIMKNAEVNFFNCTFTGQTNVAVYLDRNAFGVLINMKKSTFLNTGGHMIYKFKNSMPTPKLLLRFIIEDCYLVNSKGIQVDECFTPVDVIVRQCTFRNSISPTFRLVGLQISYSSFTMEECSFVQTVLKRWSEGWIKTQFISNVVIESSKFINNNVVRHGGAAYIERANSAVVKDSSFDNNKAGVGGGAIVFLSTIKVHFIDCIFKSNRAMNLAGSVLLQTITDAWIDNSIFESSRAKNIGGSIRMASVTSIVVSRTTFSDCYSGKNGGCMHGQDLGSLVLKDGNRFNRCTGNSGGCLWTNGVKRVSIENRNTFTNCKARYRGGCIYLKKAGEVRISKENVFNSCSSDERGGCIFALTANMVSIIDQNKFKHCLSKADGGCIFANVKNGQIEKHNTFENCTSHSWGGCIVFFEVDHVGVVNGNRFTDCLAILGGCVVFKKMKKLLISGGNQFKNCSAIDWGGCFFVTDSVHNVIENCFFEHSKAGTGGGAFVLRRTNYTIISSSHFFRNSAVNSGGAAKVQETAENGTLFIRNCTFIRNEVKGHFRDEEYGGALHILRRGATKLTGLTFVSNSARYGGAVALVNEQKVPGYRPVLFEKNSFVNNSATFGGAVYVLFQLGAISYTYTIAYCSFINNSATLVGQSIYNNEHVRLKNITIVAHERQDIYHLYSEIGKVETQNLMVNLSQTAEAVGSSWKSSGIFISSVKINITNGVRLSCPTGFNVQTRNSSYQPMYSEFATVIPQPVYIYLTVECISCPYNSYNLNRGKLFFDTLKAEEKKTSAKVEVQYHKCHVCGAGGVCDNSVVSLDNHWGFKTLEGEVIFKICPTGYCCSKETVPCSSYQTCDIGRAGILCSSCAPGYKQSFLAPGCIKKGEECNFDLFLGYLIVYSLVYTAAFVFITNLSDIITGIKSMLPWFKSAEVVNDGIDKMAEDRSEKVDIIDGEEHTEENKGSIIVRIKARLPCFKTKEGDSEEQMAMDIKKEEDEDVADPPPDTFSIGGFIQVVVLYFQVASLLRVKFKGKRSGVEQTSEEGQSTDDTREIIAKLSNFRFMLYQGVCPSDDLTLPEKEKILFFLKMSTFCLLTIAFLVYILIRSLCCKNKQEPRRDVLPIDNVQEGSETAGINFDHRLKITFIKLLKLYYTPTTQSAMQLVYCVNILGSYHLFVYGDHICYTKWQFVVLVVILPALVLFPICFELALRLLRKGLVSSTQFVASTACPYLALILHLWNRKRTRGTQQRSPEENEFTRRILETEEELFASDEKSIGWQVNSFFVVSLGLYRF